MRAHEFITESKKLFPSIVKDILQVVPNAREIWFHGSRATGKNRKSSDWDILVTVDNTVTGSDYIDLVKTLKQLSEKYKNFDIQPSHINSYSGSVEYWAREEGTLLWKDSKIPESASGYIPSEKEKNDPRFKTALTVDIKPDTLRKNAKAFGFKVSRAGIPPLLRK